MIEGVFGQDKVVAGHYINATVSTGYKGDLVIQAGLKWRKLTAAEVAEWEEVAAETGGGSAAAGAVGKIVAGAVLPGFMGKVAGAALDATLGSAARPPRTIRVDWSGWEAVPHPAAGEALHPPHSRPQGPPGRRNSRARVRPRRRSVSTSVGCCGADREARPPPRPGSPHRGRVREQEGRIARTSLTPPQFEQSCFLAVAVGLIGIAMAANASRRKAAPTTDANAPAAT